MDSENNFAQFDDSNFGGDLATKLDIKEHMKTKEINAREERSFKYRAKLIDRASDVTARDYDFQMRSLTKGLCDLHAVTPSLQSITLLREGSKVLSISRVANRRPRTLEPLVWEKGHLFVRETYRKQLGGDSSDGSKSPDKSTRASSTAKPSRTSFAGIEEPREHRRRLSFESIETKHDDLVYYSKQAIDSTPLLNNDTKNYIKRAVHVSNNLRKLYKKRFFLTMRLPPIRRGVLYDRPDHGYIRYHEGFKNLAREPEPEPEDEPAEPDDNITDSSKPVNADGDGIVLTDTQQSVPEATHLELSIPDQDNVTKLPDIREEPEQI